LKTIIFDAKKCTGCYCCQIACKDEHVGNDWSPFAKPQPDTGQFWLKVDEKVTGSTPKVRIAYKPLLCNHCGNAPCIAAATGGAMYKRSDGIVIIDPVKSVGQKQLVAACPYGEIYWNSELNIPQKCTMCAHLLDLGWTAPRCVDACPTGALQYGEDTALQSIISSATVIHPEYATKPRVYYLNLPKKFIAGALVDRAANECLEGATVAARDLATGKEYATKSDNFGDFWLENVEANHTYSIRIEHAGYYSKTIGAVYTKSDVNLGDIDLLPSR